MAINLSHLGLGIQVPNVGPKSRSFRPPRWPPPRDWVCIEDKDGNPVSRYGDHVWDFTPWAGKTMTFAFGEGPKARPDSPVIDPVNADILRKLVTWRGWGPRACQVAHSLIVIAIQLRKVIAICSANNILASDLSRYPSVIEKVAQATTPSNYGRLIAELERLRDARDFLGFELLDQAGIQRLKALQPEVSDPEQTGYIPPRIWTYIVTRVAECRNEYLARQGKIEECFAFCADAYEKNGVQECRRRSRPSYRIPFQAPRDKTGKRSGITYYGPFAETAQRFGIKDIIERWSGEITRKRGIAAITTYLNLVQYASLIDITAFTLMRKEEAGSIRYDCLRWEDDPVYGRIPLIEGETTKTDPDDSALWITSPSVEPSIRTLQSIAKMRLVSAGRWTEGGNPNLMTPALEPWGLYHSTARQVGVKTNTSGLRYVINRYPLLFDLRQLITTEDDLKIARAVCPTLNPAQFQIGNPWIPAWHQFRRTGAVNMFASGEISDSSIQLQMKHQTRLMPLYYGRGNTALCLNDEARVLLVNAHYEAMGRELAAMHTDRFISPHGDEHKARLLAPANNGEPVNLISEGDANHYMKIYRLHQIGVRLTALGACMKNGPCEGDCVTSVGHCAGGDNKEPCANVLFDNRRAPANQKRLDGVNQQLSMTPPDTPRYRHLEQEKRGLENYFAYIRKAA